MLCLTFEINITFSLAAGNRSERVYNNLFIHFGRKEERLYGKDVRHIIIAKIVILITAACRHIPVLHCGIIIFLQMFFFSTVYKLSIIEITFSLKLLL